MADLTRPTVWPYSDSAAPEAVAGEKDACGVGFLAQLSGETSYWVLQQALRGLGCMEHRGGCGGDGDSGDGAGVLCQIPWTYLKAVWPEAASARGLGMMFMPQDPERRELARGFCNEEAEALGLTSAGWRVVPVDSSVLGPMARDTAPVIEQWSLAGGPDGDAFEALLLRLRRRIGSRARQAWGFEGSRDLYVASLSSRTVVYKGMVRSEVLAQYYADLRDPRFEVSFAVYHRRFSTNTLPRWPLAQPMRLLGHNGEINTLLGNLNWAKASEASLADVWGEAADDLNPVVNPAFSDSANLDATLELMVRSGRSITDSLITLVPEAFRNQPDLEDRPEVTAMYEFNAGIQEPWDGPALLVFADGKRVGATLDRNGLRPARWCTTADGFVIMGSETGVVDLSGKTVVQKGRLGPGQMVAVDLENGQLLDNWTVKEDAAGRFPYGDWLQHHRRSVEAQPWTQDRQIGELDLLRLQTAMGFTAEDFDLVIEDMAGLGKEPTYCMGDDIPLAVLSDKPHLLYDYFKQRFAQVTNPPIDPLREKLVMSLEMHLGERRPALKPQAEAAAVIHLDTPVLNEAELAAISKQGLPVATLSTQVAVEACAGGLSSALQGLCEAAEEAVRGGAQVLVLSDRVDGSGAAAQLTATSVAMPALLAVGAVHHHLLRQKLRLRCSLVIDTAQCWSTHHMACLIGYGASAVCPWLTWETTRHWLAHPKTQKRIEQGKLPALDADKVQANVRVSLENGLRKILSKIGISLLASYHGAQIFEAIGLNLNVIEKYFCKTASRVEGVGIDTLASEARYRHQFAFASRPDDKASPLNPGGVYQWRASGEKHLFNPTTIHKLQKATRLGNYEVFQEYSDAINDQSRDLYTLRGLMEFKFEGSESVPLEEVEPASEIVRRFKTGAMSYGSISKEAHESLAIAMNRLGGKSNTGEGGEELDRFTPDPDGESRRSAIKQVASGRFGVTSFYLVNSDEIQIKIVQGAKPGEGGELPGHKVLPPIAKTRGTTPGVGLISPPPHHDIYSIEDLAELIHDLKNSNVHARVNVKLVSEVGVGTIAAGVAKAKADVILVSGYDGGTGASPRSSIQHAGAPWELGLAETNQTLLLNDLRSRVVLETDGQLKTGRDVAIACLLGAEEFGFATAPLVTLGCLMMRVCHKNTCPVGIATQDPRLRQKFSGGADAVVNFMNFIAEEMRETMAKLGFRSVNEMVGRVDKLEMRELIEHWKAKGLDYSKILYRPDVGPEVGTYCQMKQDHLLDQALDNRSILKAAQPAIKEKKPVLIELPVLNTDRVVGTITGAEVTRIHGLDGLPEDTLSINLTGSAGQSLAAFCPKGMKIKVTGDTNDYCGKGLSGAKVIIRPPEDSPFVAHENIITGNTCFYGATSGEAYIAGVAGERFCVRNSGVRAVIEGLGDHGCEYMTGGLVLCLGKTGRNFGAGMSGGVAYILDEDGLFLSKRLNPDMVKVYPLIECSDFEINEVQLIIRKHVEYTDS